MNEELVTHYVLMLQDEAYTNDAWMLTVNLPVAFPPPHTLVVLEDSTDSAMYLARVTEYRIDHKQGRFEIWLDVDESNTTEQQRDAFCEANGWKKKRCT